MFHYQADQLTQKQNYKFLTGTVAPRPIAWITTKNSETNVVNAAPFSYFTVLASKRPLVSISVNRRNGELKDTAANLLQNGEGVIHLVTPDVLAQMNETAATLSSEESELSLIDTQLTDSRTVSVPAMIEPKIRMEVKLYQYVPIKEQETVLTDLFVLEVTDYYFNESIFNKEKEYILSEELLPITRLAGNNYGHLGSVEEIIRPK